MEFKAANRRWGRKREREHRLLTVHVEAALLDLHNARVNLTHVAAAIGFLQLSDAELPGSQVVVRYANAGIMGN